MSRKEISFQKIELTYFKEGIIKDVLIKDINPITSIKVGNGKKKVDRVTLEKVNIGLKKDLKSKIENKQDAVKDKISEASKDIQRENTDTIKSTSLDDMIKDKVVYENYSLKVREKIKSILEKSAKRFVREGDVYVRFVINRDGILKDLMLSKSSDKGMGPLETIAIESIKQASPFPPFDDKMEEAGLPFSLPIRFTLHP